MCRRAAYDQVVHPKFGLGVVLNSEGTGQSARIQVNYLSETCRPCFGGLGTGFRSGVSLAG
jgi:hypothetical protein